MTRSCSAEPTVRRNGPLPAGEPSHVQVNSFSLSSLIVPLNSACSLTKALNSSGGGSSALRRACRILSSISRWRLIVSASFWRSSEVVTPAEANRPSAYGKRTGISAAALREVGVPARVLAKAGL